MSAGLARASHAFGEALGIFMVDVDGLGAYRISAAERMEAILDTALA